MKKCLYFICPTDCLESTIQSTFHQENFFYSSLGNSVNFNECELNQAKQLICDKGIREISFILADDNRIVLDALNEQRFLNVTGLKKFYSQVLLEKEYLEILWQIQNPHFLILSSFLNKKIEELKKGLSELMVGDFNLSGKIYRKKEFKFDDIFSYKIYHEEFTLN